MKIAILLAPSKYDNYGELPGCLNDIKIIKEILNLSNNFDEIISFEETVDSTNLKQELNSFFEKYSTINVDELFFYFSGHGHFENQDFYHVLTDSLGNRIRTTSLSNSELDNWVRSIKPGLFIKFIDACQSGMQYIKGSEQESIYKSAENIFDKCYFMHSSLTNQNSYQNQQISDFTKSFINALRQPASSKVRYGDIMNFISDDFETNTKQTPFFVVQALNTERFIEVNEPILKLINDNKYLKPIAPKVTKEESTSGAQSNTTLSLVEKVASDSSNFCTVEDFHKTLVEVKKFIEKIHLSGPTSDLYEIQPDFQSDTRDIPNGIKVAKWLQSTSKEYFIKLNFYTHKFTVEEPIMRPVQSIWFSASVSSLLSGNNFDDQFTGKYREVEKTEEKLNGYSHTLEMAYEWIQLNFKPKHLSLKEYAIILCFVVSKRKIKFFYGYTLYIDKSWDKKVLDRSFEWLHEEFDIKDIASYPSESF